jgi:hypothetical protein
VKRRVKGAGYGADKPDLFRGPAHGCHGRQWLEVKPAAIRHIARRITVGEKYGVQLAPFGGLRQALVIANVSQLLYRRLRVAPGCSMMATTHQKQVYVHHPLM